MSQPVPGAVTHHNVTVLRGPDAATIDTLLARPELRALIWCRLDDRRVLVDSSRLLTLTNTLTRLGLAPLEGTTDEGTCA